MVNMYSLVIADDEEIERAAFRLLINKNFPEINVIDEAVNGVELVDKIMKLTPDIAIVDINMPGINGLEAIKIIKQNNVKTKIIIHTAYSEFEYAQQALALEADEYLLKPVKRDKIISVIKKVIDNISEERKRESEHVRLKKIINDLMPIIETDFMSSIMLGDIDKDNLMMYLNILGIEFNSGYIMTINIPQDALASIISGDVEINSLKKEMLNFIRAETKNICNCVISSIINNKISVFIPVDQKLTHYEFRTWSIDLAKLINSKVEIKFGIKLQIGIGQLCNSIDQLVKSYRESINALSDRTIIGSVRHFEDLFSEKSYENPFFTYESELLKAISSCDYQQSKILTDKVFSELNPRLDVCNVKEFVLAFIAVLYKSLTEGNIIDYKESFSIQKFFKEIIKLQSMQEIKLWTEAIIKGIIDEISLERSNKINSYVRKGVEYIHENFMRDISLEEVAESIGISSYYFCRLFKQHFGKSFVQYLTEVRINQSIKLLNEDDFSIKELSERVGYNNPTYFCKVFKKHTGKTIGEYKDDMLPG